MSLPVLQITPRSNEDLVRLFHRTELHWTRALAEESALSCGTAFTNPQLPNLFDGNRILDAALPEGMSPEESVREADAHFHDRGTRCWRWILNPAAPTTTTTPLADYLRAAGAKRVAADILHLAGRPAPIEEVPGLTIIPARAGFRHARALAEESAKKWNEPQVADAHLLHLDDPQWDSLLALRDGHPVGGVGVLSVGDVGRIDQVFVCEPARRQGIGRTLMSRALEICARSLFKHVLLSVDPENAAAMALYASIGFRKVGEIAAYQAAQIIS
ncbi:MAG TPA: GNAT family N-acetyltransferase [Tepidisphaeraceae bacterium]|jgi:ribosomal protein S18 acetylase RimI-like enzyme|nr:GNAT family N-acetyltransferase [Tepidisphaeraceae bacterium]